jgi:hypothetical protein
VSVPSSELAPPTHSTASECVPPPRDQGQAGQHSLAGDGAGGADSEAWTESPVLGYALTFASEEKFEIEAKILFRFEAKKKPDFT